MKRVDIHTHAFPIHYEKAVERLIGKGQPLRSEWQWDEAKYLGEMDRWGVDVQILSLSHVYEHFQDVDTAVELCRIANDEYAEICARKPERFRMFAVIPLMDVDRACRELERMKKVRGFSGIALATNVRGKVLDDPDYADFFEFADGLHSVVFLHPLARPLPVEWSCYRLEHLIGLPVDTTFALSRLALSGFLDRFPNLRFVAAHMGGALPYLAPRIERAYRNGACRHRPNYYFRNFFFDTSGPTHEAIINCVARMLGAGRIVFGTDYPFGLGQEGMQYIEHAIWVVEHSGLTRKEIMQIFFGNAREGLSIEI